jgi:hypothetical protein
MLPACYHAQVEEFGAVYKVAKDPLFEGSPDNYDGAIKNAITCLVFNSE